MKLKIPSKEERRAIKQKLKEEEMVRSESNFKEQRALAQIIYSNIKLEEMKIQNQEHLYSLTSLLNTMRLKGEIKLVRGSFDLNSIVEAEFVKTSTMERWQLYCLNDASFGSGDLKRLN